jgi:hypothetical protein
MEPSSFDLPFGPVWIDGLHIQIPPPLTTSPYHSCASVLLLSSMSFIETFKQKTLIGADRLLDFFLAIAEEWSDHTVV